MTTDKSSIYWQNSITDISKSDSGISFLTTLLVKVGHFSGSFTTGATIYKNAALSDLGKWLESELDKIDLNIMIKIKKELHNIEYTNLENINQKEEDLNAKY